MSDLDEAKRAVLDCLLHLVELLPKLQRIFAPYFARCTADGNPIHEDVDDDRQLLLSCQRAAASEFAQLAKVDFAALANPALISVLADIYKANRRAGKLPHGEYGTSRFIGLEPALIYHQAVLDATADVLIIPWRRLDLRGMKRRAKFRAGCAAAETLFSIQFRELLDKDTGQYWFKVLREIESYPRGVECHAELVKLIERESTVAKGRSDPSQEPTGANSATNLSLFPEGPIEDPQIHELIIRLNKEPDKSYDSIALEITGNRKNAKSLMSQARRMRQQNRVYFPDKSNRPG